MGVASPERKIAVGFWGTLSIQELVRTELTEIAWDNQQAGEAISQYEIVYRDGVFWRRCNANSPSTVPERGVGMAQDSPVSGARFEVWIRALVTNAAWSLTSGARVFLGSGAGNIIQTAPAASGDILLTLGWALTQTIMEFNPGPRIQLGQ